MRVNVAESDSQRRGWAPDGPVDGVVLVKEAVHPALTGSGPIETEPPTPLHMPDQPANTDPASAFAVSVIVASVANTALHVVPQEIPDGTDVTTPLPLPDFVTSSPFRTTGQDCEPARVAEHAAIQIAIRAIWWGIELCT
jgi:hypothetical protein